MVAQNYRDLRVPVAEYAYLRAVVRTGPRRVPHQLFELVLVNYLMQLRLVMPNGTVIEPTRLGELAARAPCRTDRGGIAVLIDAEDLRRLDIEAGPFEF